MMRDGAPLLSVYRPGVRIQQKVIRLFNTLSSVCLNPFNTFSQIYKAGVGPQHHYSVSIAH